jgi:HAMP domain-containing protein
MAPLRTLLILLILLNLLAFATLQGWLGSTAPQGEPERLANQLNPERITLRPAAPARPEVARTTSAPAPAPAAPPQGAAPQAVPATPPACVAFAALSPEAARSLGETLAAQVDLKLRDVPTEVPSSWWVSLPPADSKEAAEASVAELRRQGVTDLFIVQEPGPNRYAVSLGLFRQEAQARRLLEQLQGKGVAEARVTPRGTATHRIEIRGPAERLAELASELAGRYPGASRLGCQP